MDVMINPSLDAPFNLALEELLAKEYDREVVMLWRNAPAIIIGRNQNTEAEINADFVAEHKIQVVRRITGGGAVYHDTGNVNYTIAANDRQLDPEAFARNAEIIIAALRRMGVAAEFSGRNDSLVAGRKVSGSAKSVFEQRTLFHGTLLFAADLEVLSEALKVDEAKIQSKGIRSVRSRVANLQEYLPRYTDTGKFMEALTAELLTLSGAAKVKPLPERLIAAAKVLADTKYRSWEWNYGSNTDYSYTKRGRFPAGTVEIAFNISGNRIAGMRIFGDFFGLRPAAELALFFNGCPPRKEDIATLLEAININDFIQNITPQEFLTLFSL